jgi:hypothetical protein
MIISEITRDEESSKFHKNIKLLIIWISLIAHYFLKFKHFGFDSDYLSEPRLTP